MALPALTGLGLAVAKGLGWAGLTSAGTIGVGGLVNRGVRDALHDPEDGTKAELLAAEESIDADGKLTTWGTDNKLSALFGGPKRQDVQDVLVQQKSKDFLDSIKPDVDDLSRRYGLLNGTTYSAPEFTYGTSDETTTRNRLTADAAQLNRLERLAVANGGQLPEAFNRNTSSAAIDAELTRLAEDKKRKAEEEPGGTIYEARQRTRLLEEQGKRSDYREYVRQQERSDDKRREAAQLEYQRNESRANRQQTLQLAMMDRQDRKLDREFARAENRRAQQQQSIQALIAGLANLGAGMAI